MTTLHCEVLISKAIITPGSATEQTLALAGTPMPDEPAQEPAGPQSRGRASSVHAHPSAADAVYRVKGQAHATVAPGL